MSTPPTSIDASHARPDDRVEPPPAPLVDAALESVARLRSEAMEELRRLAGLEGAEFVPASEADRLPSPDLTPTSTMVPVVHAKETLGWLVAPAVDEPRLRPWAVWLARWVGLASTVDRLRVLANADDLTSAGNRRAFDGFLPAAIEDAKGRGRPLSLMVFDIDNFKRYNDEFGHDAGDAVLCETVSLLRAVIRRGDRVFRIGGDEFVVVFADADGPRTAGAGHIDSVDQLVSRFRQRIAQLCLPQLGHAAPGTITISAGLATYPWDGQDARSLVAHADRLALESKRRGKNIITFGPAPGCPASPGAHGVSRDGGAGGRAGGGDGDDETREGFIAG